MNLAGIAKKQENQGDLVQARYGSRVVVTKGKRVRNGGLVHARHPRIPERDEGARG